MWAEFRNTLRKLCGAVIGWSIGMFLYDWLIGSMYDSVLEMGDEMGAMIQNYPEQLTAFFPSISDFNSPIGFIDTYFSTYMTFIIGIFAVGAAAKLLVGEEESGILDLVMAYPVSRTKLFWGRFLAYLTAIVMIMLACWVGWLLPSQTSGMPLTSLELLMPMVPLFAILALFGALALLLSMLLPASRIAGSLSGALLIVNFLLVGLSTINPDLKPIFEVTPLYFYQGAKFIADPNWGWIFGLLGGALMMILAAWAVFLRRDIRVGGEAGWRLSLPQLKRK